MNVVTDDGIYKNFTGIIDCEFVKGEVENAEFFIAKDKFIWKNGIWKDKNNIIPNKRGEKE